MARSLASGPFVVAGVLKKSAASTTELVPKGWGKVLSSVLAVEDEGAGPAPLIMLSPPWPTSFSVRPGGGVVAA